MIAKFENRGVILIFNRIPTKKNSLFKRVYNEYAMIFYLSYHATKQSIFLSPTITFDSSMPRFNFIDLYVKIKYLQVLIDGRVQ